MALIILVDLPRQSFFALEGPTYYDLLYTIEKLHILGERVGEKIKIGTFYYSSLCSFLLQEALYDFSQGDPTSCQGIVQS